jgi:hypothetical protein
MLTRHYMSSKRVIQLTAVASFELHGRELKNQPTGSRPLKQIPKEMKNLTHAECKKAVSQGLIHQKTIDFLTAWVDETWPTIPRPKEYKYLKRPDPLDSNLLGRRCVLYDGLSDRPNRIVVRVENDAGLALPVGNDADAEAPDDHIWLVDS